MECGRKGTGNSHLAMLRKDLYPRLHGRNLAGRTVILTSRIAVEADSHLPQFHVRCLVGTLELSSSRAQRMLVPLVPESAETASWRRARRDYLFEVWLYAS
jgi:hypothetical protein